MIKKSFIPLLVSLLLVIASVIISIATDYILVQEFYIGTGLLAVSILLFFTKRNIYLYVFGLTLVVGLVGFADIFIFSFKVGIFSIGVSPTFLLIGGLLMYVEKETFFPEKKVSEQKSISQSQIDRFKKNYNAKNPDELKQIANPESPYVEAAKIAAQSILDEKNVL